MAAGPTQSLTKGTTYEVYIAYDKSAKKGNQLKVTNYPPGNLKEGDKIKFRSDREGILVLVFTNGSNFSRQIPDVVVSDETGTVVKKVIREMTTGELSDVKKNLIESLNPDLTVGAREQAATIIGKLPLNAFPFQCFFGGASDDGSNDPKVTGGNEAYTILGGFPPPPDGP